MSDCVLTALIVSVNSKETNSSPLLYCWFIKTSITNGKDNETNHFASCNSSSYKEKNREILHDWNLLASIPLIGIESALTFFHVMMCHLLRNSENSHKFNRMNAMNGQNINDPLNISWLLCVTRTYFSNYRKIHRCMNLFSV